MQNLLHCKLFRLFAGNLRLLHCGVIIAGYVASAFLILIGLTFVLLYIYRYISVYILIVLYSITYTIPVYLIIVLH